MSLFRRTPRLPEEHQQMYDKLRKAKAHEFLRAMATGTLEDEQIPAAVIAATAKAKQWRFPKPDNREPVGQQLQANKLKDAIAELLTGTNPEDDTTRILPEALTNAVEQKLNELKRHEWLGRLSRWVIAPAFLIEWAAHQPPNTELSTIISVAAALGFVFAGVKNIELTTRTRKIVGRTFHAAATFLAEHATDTAVGTEYTGYLQQIAQALLRLKQPEVQEKLLELAQKKAKLNLIDWGKDIFGTTALSIIGLHLAQELLKHHIIPPTWAHAPISGHMQEFTLLSVVAGTLFYLIERKAMGKPLVPGRSRLEAYRQTFASTLNRARAKVHLGSPAPRH